MNKQDNAEIMKEYSKRMSFSMNVMMSLSLTIIGLLQANALSVGNVIFNFLISFTIMRSISYFFDVGNFAMRYLHKKDIDPHSLKGRVLMALLIDVVNSPAMTFIMFSIAYLRAFAAGGIEIPYLPTLLRSMLVSFVCAFFLCMIFSPLFEKLLRKEDLNEND